MRPVNAARLERKLRAIVGAQGSQLFADLADVAPLIVLEADRAEWGLAGGERRCWGGYQLAPNVAQVNVAQLFNPLESGVLVVVEDWWGNSNGALHEWRLGQRGVTGGTGLALVFRNHRDVRAADDAMGTGGITAELRTFAGAIPASSVVFRLTSNTPQRDPWPMECMLGPGDSLMHVNGAINQSLEGFLRWREVPLENSRLG